MGKNTKPVWDECKHTWKIVVWVMVWSKPCCCFICRYGYTKGGGRLKQQKTGDFLLLMNLVRYGKKKIMKFQLSGNCSTIML